MPVASTKQLVNAAMADGYAVPAINIVNSDFRDGSDTEGGFNILLGVRQRSGLFFELKVGAVDSPDLKFGVGYTFR